IIVKGKDAADLFSAIVKNVVSKNIEVKKLVYVYLMRYAKEEQGFGLLSISTSITINDSAAVQALQHICPKQIDLIRKNHRRLCNLLVDIDEWKQVIVVNVLTRYARSQSIDPNKILIKYMSEIFVFLCTQK
ncbi:unnamed protein product, partial [Rotaria sp. Silwood2]